jgi:uncharacterized protein (TIGR02145 family)
VTDIDGNVYKTVSIGSQCWMKENLRVTKYRNGNNIPTNLDSDSWDTTINGAYSIYNDSSGQAPAIYGKLYNWYAVADSRNLCPTGWHVPTDGEWTTLENFLGGRNVAGGKMKKMLDWQSPNIEATNESGFSGLPGGYRGGNGGGYGGIGISGGWWSSTEISSTNAWYRFLSYNYGYSSRNDGYGKLYGFSVRCLRD